MFSTLTVTNFLSVGGTQVLDGTGNWIGPGTNITGAQGAIGAQGAQGAQGPQGNQGGGQPTIYGPYWFLWVPDSVGAGSAGFASTNSDTTVTGVNTLSLSVTGTTALGGGAVDLSSLYLIIS